MGMLSHRMAFLCSVVFILVAIHIHQSEAGWGRRWRAPRIRTPRIRLPRIRLPPVRVPRIRLPRFRLPRVRVPRIILPSLRVPRIRLPPVRFPRIRFRFPRIRLPPIRRIRFPSVRLPRLRRIPLPRLRRILPKLCVRVSPIRISRTCAKAATTLAPVTTKWPTPISTPTASPVTTKWPTPISTPLPTSTSTSTPNDPCTVIQSRAQWSAPALTPSGPFLVKPVQKVALYVAGGVDCNTSLACIQQAKGQHTQVKNFNFLVGGDGTVLEGRGWNNVSDHIKSYYNILELGVAFLAKCEPSDAAFSALGSLIECGIGMGKLGGFQHDTLVRRYTGC